ncbi:hypothetical protein U1Q18_012529 [Sarracenia purpurea var. burkii]
MATGRGRRWPFPPFASVCVIFAVLVLTVLSEGAHHSPTPAPAPAPAPGPGGHGGTSPSAAPGVFSPHFFISTLFASLAFILPFCPSFLY